MLSGNRNFEGRINPDVKMNYLASPPLCVAYALAGTMDIDILAEPLGHDEQGKDVYLKDIWPSEQEIAQTIGQAVRADMFRKSYGEVFAGDERWNGLEVPAGERFAWDEHSTYVRLPPYFKDMPATPEPVADVHAARVLALLGDSVTTDHISPAGSIKRDGPAGAYLQELGVAPKDFNSYGSRRGNHEVMMRGTFANIRLRNRLAAGTEGGVTRYLGAPGAPAGPPVGETMSIYDAAMRYQRERVPLVVLAGKEYGSGSSRDWAAKGTSLLGVRAVLAESFERIHRSNLIGMGVLPLQFPDGQSVESMGLTGEEVVLDHRPGRGDGRRRRCAADGARGRTARRRRARAVRCAGTHRHAARGRLLPPRGYPPVRPATALLDMSDATDAPPAEDSGGACAPQLLLDLLTARGPSGYETAAAAVWRDAASAFATVSTDVVGTPLASVSAKHGDSSPPRLIVMGHIDEIGLMVTHIDDEGCLWFRGVGGWDPQILVGQRVLLDTRDGPVTGVVGKKPIHLLRDEDRKKVADIREMHIDIGARDGDDARERVRDRRRRGDRR